MNKSNRPPLYLYILVISLFIILVAPNLFSKGMFMDGMIYAVLSRNMAEGLGNFWHPHFSEILYPEFYGHPPLAFGLQSIWFRIFGDTIYVERFYSLSTFFLVGLLIVAIWKELTGSIKTAWQALLFWITIPLVSWACSNNMLENTLSVFTVLSVWLYLKSRRQYRFLFLILGGLSLSLGLLTKGFVALLPWCFPFWNWVFRKENKFFGMLTDSLILMLASILPIFLLFTLSDSAAESLTRYFDLQIMGGMLEVVTVKSRFNIISKFIMDIIPALGLGIILVLLAIRKYPVWKELKQNTSTALLFIVFAISGVLPILITLKQRRFYLLPVYPFFAIGLAYLLSPLINRLIKTITDKPRRVRILSIVSFSLLFISLILSGMQINRIGRDRNKIHDTALIIQRIGPDQTINMCNELFTDWAFHNYFARHANISLDPNYESSRTYFVVKDSCSWEGLLRNYTRTDLSTRQYHLYKKTSPPPGDSLTD